MYYARRYYVRPKDPKRESGCKIFSSRRHIFHFREHNCPGCRHDGACNLQWHMKLADAFDLTMPESIALKLGKTSLAGQYVWPCPQRETFNDQPETPAT